MASTRVFLLATALIVAPQLVPILAAQDMDTVEGVQRGQYEQLAAEENTLQGQMDVLVGLKSRIDELIAQVGASPADDYTQEADRYRRIELLLPPATRYSQDLAQKQKQMERIRKRKDELRAQILDRRSDLPAWWRD